VIIGAVVLLIYRVPGFAWFDPYDLLIAVPVILTGLSIGVFTRKLEHVHHPFVLLAVGVVCLNHRLPWALQVLMLAVGSGLLVYQFGRHGVAMITARPMRREPAAAARAAAADTLLILAGLTSVVVAAALWFSLKILILAALTLPIAVLCSPAPEGMRVRRWKLWLLSLKSWYSYAPQNLPGLMQSLAGSLLHRVSILLLAAELTGIALVSWEGSPLPRVFAIGAEHHATVNAQLDAADAGPIERVKHGAVTWFTTFAAMAALPVVIPIFLAMAMVTPVLCEAAAAASKSRGKNPTQSILADIQSSPDLIERSSL
jgi:hypothetical protein